ncbi:hypothetical protein [Flavobacterium mesophilum]|uniref:hypothetical protein n=1 Tax=Flavobacterium mesophilum TaxID=3143495 RepID=UPI0031D9518B
MKKKFTLEIASPCSQNFDKMIPNANGSFCNSCMKNVIDLSKKTNSEVARFISENKDRNICARLKTTQLKEEFQYNETSKINNLKYAAVVASILLASNMTGQEKVTVETEIGVPQPANYIVGKVANVQNIAEQSIIIKGKLLEAKTNKPFDRKIFSHLTLSINGSERVKVNSKTGYFSIPIKVLSGRDTLEVIVQSSNYYLSKTIPFNIEMVKGGILTQDIIVNEEDLSQAVILTLGGLGINYLPENNFRKS